MQDPPKFEISITQNRPRPVFGERADPDHPFRSQDVDDAAQMIIAGLIERRAFRGRKFVRCSIATGIFHEYERTVIGDEVVAKEALWLTPMIGDGPPYARTTDFASRASKTLYASLRMFFFGPVDSYVDTEPVAHARDFSEGDAGLRHAIGAGIHAQEDDLLGSVDESTQVRPVAATGVPKRIVDVRDGRPEPHRLERLRECLGGSNQTLCVPQDQFAPSWTRFA
jgi:hypothetical protein